MPEPNRYQRRADLCLLLAYWGLIYWLSDQPVLPVPMWFPHQDKLHHAMAYGFMSLLAWRYLRHRYLNPASLWLASVLLCSLYGVTDELHQSFVPGRSADSGDWLADTLGAAASTGILYRLRRLRVRQA